MTSGLVVVILGVFAKDAQTQAQGDVNQHRIVYRGAVASIAWNSAGSMLALQVPEGIVILDSSYQESTLLEEQSYLELDDKGGFVSTLSRSGTGISWEAREISPRLATTYVNNDVPRSSGIMGIQIWDPNSVTMDKNIDTDHMVISDVKWSPSSLWLAVAYQLPYIDDCACAGVRIWDPFYGNSIVSTEIVQDVIHAIDWHPEELYIAGGTAEGTVVIWRSINGTTVLTYGGHSDIVEDVNWHPGGDMIASASVDSTIHIWNANNGSLIKKLEPNGGAVNSIDWNSDGTLLTSAGKDAIIRIWDVEMGEVIATFEGHEDEIIDLDWSPDDQLIATASRDGTVRIWEVDLPAVE